MIVVKKMEFRNIKIVCQTTEYRRIVLYINKINKGDIISRTVLAMQVKKYIGAPITQKEPKQWHFPRLASSPLPPLSHVPGT